MSRTGTDASSRLEGKLKPDILPVISRLNRCLRCGSGRVHVQRVVIMVMEGGKHTTSRRLRIASITLWKPVPRVGALATASRLCVGAIDRFHIATTYRCRRWGDVLSLYCKTRCMWRLHGEDCGVGRCCRRPVVLRCMKWRCTRRRSSWAWVAKHHAAVSALHYRARGREIWGR
jgi:hypothetical protein